MPYSFHRFDASLREERVAFAERGKPGSIMPDFDLATVDGARVGRDQFIGERPLLLNFASITCPMTAGAAPALRNLWRDFGQEVAFVTVYVREAHPGEHYPQPSSLQEKTAHAREYRDRDRIAWTVAVDDVGGNLHRALDSKPSALYIMDRHGLIAFRALWATEEGVIRAGLEAVVAGHRVREERRPRVRPLLRGLGETYDVLGEAGDDAKRDLRVASAPLYGLAWLAARYRPLPPLGRGVAALVTVGVVVAGIVIGTRYLIQRAGRSEPRP